MLRLREWQAEKDNLKVELRTGKAGGGMGWGRGSGRLSDLKRARAGTLRLGGEADFVWHLLLTIWEKGPMIWIEEEKRLFVNEQK